MTKPTLEEKFIGCLVGTAIGDALGAPFEGKLLPPGLTAEHILEDFTLIPGFPYGQYTDDTQLTIATAESIISKNNVDGADIAQRFTKLWKNRTILGAGLACTQAAYKMIYQGVHWSQAGAPEGQAGNGAAMRISPVALWNHKQPEKLLEDVYTASIITHKDKKSIAGALAIATAINHLLTKPKIETDELLTTISENTATSNQEFARDIRGIKDLLSLKEDEAIEIIVEKAQQGIHKGSWCGRITPYVVPTVLLALHNFLRHPTDYGKAVTASILTGGDTDTTAAITGALSGTHNGTQVIPKHLRQGAHNSKYIHQLAKDLYQAKMAVTHAHHGQ